MCQKGGWGTITNQKLTVLFPRDPMSRKEDVLKDRGGLRLL
ncbi:MAG: hypothetical protein Tsb0026_21160 [Sulfuricaulis sp.]